MTLVEVGGQHVDPDAVVAVLTPTSAHVSLTDGADITLRSVLVLRDGTVIPCSAPPRLAVRQLKGEDEAAPKSGPARSAQPTRA